MANSQLTTALQRMNVGSESAKVPNPKDGNGKWVVEREFGKEGDGKINNGYGAAVNSNGDIFIADWLDNSIKIFDSEGKFKTQLQENLEFPYDVVITPDGTQQYVTDNAGLVHVFDSQGKNMKQFPAMSPDGEASNTDESQLCGLAVDNDGNIFVANNSKRYISKHKSDGSHISSFKTNIPPWFIAVTHQGKIIVCPNLANKNAEILDHNGELLHTINKPPDAKSWRPVSSCCSDDGIVYITSYGKTKDGGIYSFTEDGTYLGCVTKDVFFAQGIALSDGNRLVVVQWSGHPAKIFCYKET